MAELTQDDAVFRPKPGLPPPPNTVGVVGWLRKNLFGGPFDTLMTVAGAGLIGYVAYSLYLYGIANAVWEADSYRECLDINMGKGACWAGVKTWTNGYLYGRYPNVEQWRVNLGAVILAVWLAPFWFTRVTHKIPVGVSAVLTYPFLAGALFLGGEHSVFLQSMVGVAMTLFTLVWLEVAGLYLAGRSLLSVIAERLDDLGPLLCTTIVAVLGLVAAAMVQLEWAPDAAQLSGDDDYFVSLGIFVFARSDLGWFIFSLLFLVAGAAPAWFVTDGIARLVVMGVLAVAHIATIATGLEGGERSALGYILVSVSWFGFVAVWGQFLMRSAAGGGWSGVASRAVLPLVLFIGGFLFQANWDLEPVSTVNWGGLFLTLVISGIAISSALPTGVILALGRRSKMPVIRVFCTAFIELFRSVPLITILFMAVTMMPLFLPVEINLDKLVLVIIAVCIFAAAYMAEIVRGGLQAINKGQYEAAQAMGLNYWKMMTLIIMPQALKLMIPNIVGNFMGLLKDTTLVSIIGLYDILLMAKASGQDTQWLGMHTEPFLFVAAVFFVICFCMSKYSQHLERTIGGGYGRR